MKKAVEEMIKKIDTETLMDKPASAWREILAKEVHVYVFGEIYIAKRFDQINYVFCDRITAKEIVIDNLYALLRFKYFTKVSDEVDDKIAKIVNNFTQNLKTSLKKVSFDINSDTDVINMLPDGCVAFRNGVYDFIKNEWMFKYDILKLETLKNTMYLYDDKYCIFWYLNIEFEPLDISITDVSLQQFVEMMKEFTKEDTNYCFELMYNIAHDIDNKYSPKRFLHLCEILGYTLLNSFSQNFVMLIGSGQNGKNSLFDGCFTNKVVPTPAANSLKEIENDRFITGSLENKSHNFFFETSTTSAYEDSTMLKAITGSMYQTIQPKGINKYSGIINCKYIWSANDQEKVKFSDTSTGFRRRINLFEIWYQWDAQKRFMKRGDYYDTTFSDTLSEIKDNVFNTIIYVYFGMYGILSATKNRTSNFKFTENDWRLKYSDIDVSLKEKIERISLNKILEYLSSSDNAKILLYSLDKKRLYDSKGIKELGYHGFDGMLELFSNEEDFLMFASENDFYINVRCLQEICGDKNRATAFTQNLKKLYNLPNLPNIYNNQPYVKCRFVGKKLTIILE